MYIDSLRVGYFVVFTLLVIYPKTSTAFTCNVTNGSPGTTPSGQYISGVKMTCDVTLREANLALPRVVRELENSTEYSGIGEITATSLSDSSSLITVRITTDIEDERIRCFIQRIITRTASIAVDLKISVTETVYAVQVQKSLTSGADANIAVVVGAVVAVIVCLLGAFAFWYFCRYKRKSTLISVPSAINFTSSPSTFSHTMVASSVQPIHDGFCEICGGIPDIKCAGFGCEGAIFCVACDGNVHFKGALLKHKKQRIRVMSSLCMKCRTVPPEWDCTDCDLSLCLNCANEIHENNPDKQSHVAVPIQKQAPPSDEAASAQE
eukprot:PhF_6_TR27023/c0_g1_i1/m.39469